MLPIESAKQIINAVSQKTDRVILFYSGGKDSLALLDLMAPHFQEVVCVFMYFVKGLQHCDFFLEYAQRAYPNVSVLQLPHFVLSIAKKTGRYCKREPKTKILSISDIDAQAREITGIEWSFYGMKQADGLNRRLMLRGYEMQGISTKSQKVYPLSLWLKNDVLRYCEQKRLPKPIQYSDKPTNGVGFNVECMLYMREHYPQDLQKFFSEFPLSEQILFEYDYKASKVSGHHHSPA